MSNEKQEQPMINGAGFQLMKQEIESLKELMEHRFQEVLTNQQVNTTRINSRRDEHDSLERRVTNVEKDHTERITKLEISQSTVRWLIGLGIAAAGVVAAAISAII